jgi:hypothetical protein
MEKMLVRVGAVGAAYQDIIQVAESKIQSLQYLVHKLLEGLSSIPQSKRHAKKFPEPKRSDHHCLV